ncbi:MAG: 3'-5' exonuclease [Candidatus Nanoarchaeia archaeon]|nr:3'-5' exonuclease [Candidatus Nanoarchaeia archaeon]MDD5741205.1 3'-5' exonuclease [Candidatus Nanoarchaeia archaeon]
MIVVDIETSGLDFDKCGIWQIGAIDLESMGEFLEECRIDDEDKILNSNAPTDRPVLEIIGKTKEQLRDKSKQSQRELLEHFFKWCERIRIKNCICQNPQFDLGFICTKSNKYRLKMPIHHRAFDVHSLASLKYFQLNNKFLIKEEHSDMGLTNTLDFCGIKDNRGAHNALEDAKLTAECFSRLVYGKGLFPEYSKFKIPNYLQNDNL